MIVIADIHINAEVPDPKIASCHKRRALTARTQESFALRYQ
jgi:hypothetical protein